MGRSRRRERVAAGNGAAPQRGRERKATASQAVSPVELRRSLGAYLGGAIVLAVVVLGATVSLAPAWAPWVVLLADASLSLALSTWAQGRMAGMALTDEDRLLQTLATGLLVLVFVFAAIAAIVLTAT